MAGLRCQFTLAQRNFCFKTHQRLKGRGYQLYEALNNEYEGKVSWQKSSNSRCHFKNGEEARSKFHFKQLELEELTRKHPFRKEKVNLHRHQPTHATLNTPMPPKTLPHINYSLFSENNYQKNRLKIQQNYNSNSKA